MDACPSSRFPYHNLVPPFPLHLSRPNSSTNDCIGLTGGYIPSWVKGAFLVLVASRPTIAKRIFTKLDPPADFLSTPLGAALRPSIDVIFCRNSTPPIVHQPTSYKPSPLAPSTSALSSGNQTTDGHPPVHEPGIVPQPAGRAPRRRGDVHVRDVPAVQDDRAHV